MAQFNSYLDILDPTAAIDFCSENGTVRHYKKEERFIQQGTVARYAAIVVSGYFKLTTLNESGDEAVINFAFPGQIITDIHSSIYGEPSEMSVIAGADSEILRVPLKKFATYLSANLSAEHSALFRMTYMRYLTIYRKSPEQRYIELCNHYPNLINTVALKDLASYLLISPTHLSRIRRKLATKP